MAVVALLVIVGLVLLGTGITRGSGLALILGMFLMTDAMVLYIIYGPAAGIARTLFPTS